MIGTAIVDVAILGGGLAGLSLALQLKQRRNSIRVLVIDPRSRPAPERTSTVGESFAEVGAHYLRDVLGLADHLDADQLPKFGLRFFVGDQWDLGERFEIGPLDPRICELRGGRFVGLPLRTHQVDRGRLENELAHRCRQAGVILWLGTRVQRVRLAEDGHRVHPETGEAVRARWVVIAAGGMDTGFEVERVPLRHRLSAAWTRIEGDLDVDSWSRDPAYATRTLPGLRRYSTNHLMGPGYWAWVIPLPTGVTSVGVVADRDALPPVGTDYPDLVRWLGSRDPRLSAALAEATPADGDFHAAGFDAFRVDHAFRADRVAVVGQSAATVDVLYSPGADLIAVGNCMATDIIEHDLDGGRIAGLCAIANQFFAGFAEGLAEIYRGQYGHFGSPDFVASKVTWDSALYFGFHTLLFRHGYFGNARFMAGAAAEVRAVQSLQARVQGRFREGRFRPLLNASAGWVEWGAVDWLMEAYFAAESQEDGAAVASALRRTLTALEGLARRLEGP